MKKIIIAMIALSATVAVCAQNQEADLQTVKMNQHRLGLGVRVGTSSAMQKVSDVITWNGNRRLGALAALDVDYTFLTRLKNDPSTSLGVRTGVGLAYGYSYITANEMLDAYMVTDQEQTANHILYTVDAQQLREDHSQLMVEIPVELALRTVQGFVFYTGPKFNLPVGAWWKSTYRNPDITAYFTELGVAERNHVVTGRLSGVAEQGDKELRTAALNLLWNIELGYEWTMKNGNGVSLTVFGDAPLANIGYKQGDASTHFITVGTPKAGGPDIKTYSVMNSYGRVMSQLDFGVKVAYTFCWDK